MRKTIWTTGILLLLMSGFPALADSISPSALSASLGVGGSATVSKTVTITAGTPTTSQVDVYFLADTTGSMGGVIDSVALAASSILGATSALGNVNWAVGEYKDNGDSYVYRLDQGMTGTASAVQTGINDWYASGGGDWQEAELYALDQAATDSATGWRTGSTRILVWMGDAPGWDPSGPTGVTLSQAEGALTSNGIKVEAMDVGYGTGNNLDTYGQASAIASATGGAYYSGLSASSIVAAIQNAITTSFATYGSVSLDTTEAGPDVSVTYTCTTVGGCTGAFDRSADHTFNFDVTFTGVNPGTDNFNIYATVNGGRVATEADSITVGTVAAPEPSAVLLFGLMVLGIGVPMKLRRRS